MRFQSIDAGLPPEHATEQGVNSTQTVVSARDAQKLLRMPGAKSIRQGATLIVVDAQGGQYIVKEFDGKAFASDPEAALDEEDELSGQEPPEATSEEGQVIVASAGDVSATVAEVHLAQAPAEGAPAQEPSEEQNCKDKDDKKAPDGGVDEEDDDACFFLWGSHWGLGLGLGVMGAGLVASVGGGGGCAGGGVVLPPPSGPGAPDLPVVALGFVINGQAAGDYSGYSVSAAGDVNGDGLADLIVGASDSDPAMGNEAGRSYVVFGKAGGVAVELSDIANGVGGFVINGQAGEDYSGYSVSAAGDVNGDGLADLIVGAADSDPATGDQAGRSYVVFGKADGTAVELSDIDAGSGGFVINGEAEDDYNGFSVSAAGDVNGDGLADLIVGAHKSDPATGDLAGRSYVVFGKAGGAPVDLTDIASGLGGFVINGEAEDDHSGYSVSAAGDVNGDGLADLIVGAHESDTAAGANAGRSYVVFGKADGTAVELSDIASGSGGFVINGQAEYDYSGISVSSAGDVNGDGLADLIVGASEGDPATGDQAGRSYVVFGKADGTPVELSDIGAGLGGFVINGQAADDHSGISVSSAGDVNGDGLADLIVGASDADGATGNQAGRSYVVFGKTGGTAVELSDIANGLGGFVINGQAGEDYSGVSVSAAGDVNGDGRADLIVGASRADPASGSEAGRSYVVFGKADGTPVNLGDVAAGGDAALAIDFTGDGAANSWAGTAASEIALGGAGDDTLVGNGGADVLYGGAGDDTLVLNADNIARLSLGLTDGRLARVDGGGGIDTLAIDGDNVTLDLSVVANQAAGDLHTGSRIASIEKINLTGSGNNTLILTVGDVLDMAGMNLFNTSNGWSNITGSALGTSVQRHQLVVDGDAGDVVSSLEAAGTWSLVGTVSDGSNLYKVFNATHTATSAQLLINTQVTEALDTTTTPPSAPDLAAEDDSGVSNTDNITVYTNDLNFSGTAESGATVSLFADIDSDGVIDAGELLGTGLATGGNYSIDTNLALGSHNMRVIATDLAGNSAVSGTTVVDVIAMAQGFVINGQAAGDSSGFSVSAAGDVNGDGLADLIVGGFESDPATGDAAGRSYVVFGKADGTAVELSDIDTGLGGFVINGQAAYDLSGYSVSSAGDVDGDGLADLILGARDATNMGELSGRSYVVFGKADGTAVELSNIDAGSGGFVINGQAAFDRSGISVSAAGDVNGDGLSDLIVGAHESDLAAGSAAGRSYVVFGKADGAAVELSNIDAGSGGFVINGQAAFDRSGYSVSSAGDVNGDGLADVIVGARTSDPAAGTSAGRSYVVFGKADGTVVELSDIDAGSGGFVINGQESNEYSGNSVSSAGDVNGDGLADLIVGAYGSDPVTGDEAGRSYVVFGKADGTSVELSDIDAGSGGFVINGEAEYDFSGLSVSSAGDVNGDGLADLIVGAYGSDPAAGEFAGRSYVVFGKAGGTAVELSDIASGSGGFVINGEAAFDYSGISVSAAGDVNGDGLADLIVGANNSDPAAGANAGRSYVVFGKADGTPVNLGDVAAGGDVAMPIDFTGDSAVDSWAGTAASEIALGGEDNDTLVGNGGADVLYGGAGDDTLVLNADNIARLSLGLTDRRLARVDGGGGIDTLAIDGDNVTLDLSVIANQAAGDLDTGSRIASIEKINLTGSGNNTLILTVGDVLDMAGMNLFNTSNDWSNTTGSALGVSVQRHQMVVDGDAGDVVSSSGWIDTGDTVSSDGQTYAVYNSTAGTLAQMLVDVDITRTGVVM